MPNRKLIIIIIIEALTIIQSKVEKATMTMIFLPQYANKGCKNRKKSWHLTQKRMPSFFCTLKNNRDNDDKEEQHTQKKGGKKVKKMEKKKQWNRLCVHMSSLETRWSWFSWQYKQYRWNADHSNNTRATQGATYPNWAFTISRSVTNRIFPDDMVSRLCKIHSTITNDSKETRKEEATKKEKKRRLTWFPIHYYDELVKSRPMTKEFEQTHSMMRAMIDSNHLFLPFSLAE